MDAFRSLVCVYGFFKSKTPSTKINPTQQSPMNLMCYLLTLKILVYACIARRRPDERSFVFVLSDSH